MLPRQSSEASVSRIRKCTEQMSPSCLELSNVVIVCVCVCVGVGAGTQRLPVSEDKQFLHNSAECYFLQEFLPSSDERLFAVGNVICTTQAKLRVLKLLALIR